MSFLPDGLPGTASRKKPPPRWPVFVFAGLFAILLVLLAVNLLRAWSFSPGQEIEAGWVEGITVSPRDSPYPPPDVDVFTRRPEAVYVYVTAKEMPSEMPSAGRLEARAERADTASALAWFLRGGGQGISLRWQEARPGSGTSPDVVSFVLREKSGGALSPGSYTVGVYRETGAGGAGRTEPVARKFFVIRG